MTDRKTSQNADGIFEPFAADEVPWEDFEKGARFGGRFRHLSRFGGGGRVGVAIEELPPGRQTCPFHYHMMEEESVYILEGSLTLRLGSKRYTMKAGDFACFPAGQKAGHCLINEGDAVCRYLIIGENNPNEVCVYPDNDRVSMRALGEGFRYSAKKDYWDGVETGETP